MIPDISRALSWLEKHPHSLIGIQHGLEREALRINKDGSVATTCHPKILGSALTHRWITTDFVEILLEFITSIDSDIDRMLTVMSDIHRYTARNLGDERMWPLSIPCYITKNQDIKLAQYGTSNIGQLKTLYREGLKNRYGIAMQIISGVHYNFSLPMSFWQARYAKIDKKIISESYFSLIRNYYRFGWVIPYLFGASPAVCSSFLRKRSSSLQLKKTSLDIYYLPYATSLRLSDLGYTSKLQSNLGITFNELHEYVLSLKQAIKTPSKEYEKIGLEKNGKRLQINSNILQIENELYLPIRPKCITFLGESQSDTLLNKGIEYVEVRSLDINPFSPIGIDDRQIRLLNLFMIWCVLVDAPYMNYDELICVLTNWNRVIIEGRKPGLTLNIGCKTTVISKIGIDLFRDLKLVAQMIDSIYGGEKYQKVCDELVNYFDNPELTFSARILRSMIEHGINKTGCDLATIYHNKLKNEPLELLRETDFLAESKASVVRQQKIEESDNETFEVFLARVTGLNT